MLFKRHATQLLQTQLPYPLPYGGELHSVSGPGRAYSPLTVDFDALVRKRLDYFNISGLAVAIVHEGQTFSRGYGIAKLPDTPVTPETIFYGASTTKAFVAAGLSMLIDESNGTLAWTTPISELIRDDFVLNDSYTTLHATLEDAAAHRTGLPRHDLVLDEHNQTVRDVVRLLRFLPLTKPLRSTFQYCNLMYITLGYVIEKLTGHWLGDFLARRIWTPLRMTSTFFSLSDALDSGKPMARGHYWLRSAEKFIEVDYVDESSAEGAGAILSNVLDYAKWIRVMIDRSPPISKAGHKALVFPRILEETDVITGNYIHYGYGWETMQYHGYEVIFHDGSENGFGSNVLFIPEKRWGCVMMANTGDSPVQDILPWHLIDDLLDVPKSSRINRTKIYVDSFASLHKTYNTTWVREILYPSDEIGNVPISLPLEKYAGTYSHPGYGLWYIQYANNTLWNRMDRGPVLSWKAKLEHLSGDRFFAVIYNDDTPEDPAFFSPEFLVSLEGKVEKLGLDLEDEM